VVFRLRQNCYLLLCFIFALYERKNETRINREYHAAAGKFARHAAYRVTPAYERQQACGLSKSACCLFFDRKAKNKQHKEGKVPL
jgi:hypothetical protein